MTTCPSPPPPPPPTQVVASLSRGGLPEFLLGSVAGFLTHHCKRPVAVLHGLRDAAGRYSFEAPPPPVPVPASAVPADSTAKSPPGGVAACPTTHMAADSAAAGIATAAAAAAPATEAASAPGIATAAPAPASTPGTETVSAAPAPATETVSAGRNLLVPVEGSDESLVSCRWTLDHLYRPGEWTLEGG